MPFKESYRFIHLDGDLSGKWKRVEVSKNKDDFCERVSFLLTVLNRIKVRNVKVDKRFTDIILSVFGTNNSL